MQFKENAEVFTSTGDKVGRLDRVVIDPKSNEVTHLVVKKGLLFTTDKVVPLDSVASTQEDRIVLEKDRDDPDDFPDFEESHYIPAQETRAHAEQHLDGLRPLAWYYPLPGEPWWRVRMGSYPGYPPTRYVRKTELNIPDDAVPLEEGAKVVSREGGPVGNVERVFTDAEQQVTHVVISRGMVSKTRKLVPSMWVQRAHADTVHLSVSKPFVESLPDYKPED